MGSKTADHEKHILLDFINDNLVTHWVIKLTRGDNILDLVLASDAELLDNVNVRDKLSNCDHNLVKFNINIPHEKKKVNSIELDFKKS